MYVLKKILLKTNLQLPNKMFFLMKCSFNDFTSGLIFDSQNLWICELTMQYKLKLFVVVSRIKDKVVYLEFGAYHGFLWYI